MTKGRETTQAERIAIAKECLANGKYRMMQLFDVLPCRQVSPAELGELWREDMLDNLNYPEDYERLIGN